MPRSGWDVFRAEKYSEVVDQGFSGKEISKQLGDRWKKVEGPEKKKYGLKAEFLKAVQGEPDILERTSTVHKSSKLEPLCVKRSRSV